MPGKINRVKQFYLTQFFLKEIHLIPMIVQIHRSCFKIPIG